MILPLGHESLQGRRWPYVTIGIIALNVLIFAVTYGPIVREARQLTEIQQHVLWLAAAYPEVPMTEAEQEIVDKFRRAQPANWERLRSPNRNPVDVWDLQMRMWDSNDAAREMASLGEELDRLQSDSTIGRYAFHPSRPTMSSYITANFLHGGWMHLIFNMWFLWLSGAVLEDKWGRPLYAGVYLLSGIGALWMYAMLYPDSLIPLIGASGAIAALMGAFLVRFATTRIHLGFVYWILRPRLIRFDARAYTVLPLWLVTQLFASMLQGESAGVAYWAHIGGFGVGVAFALMIRFSGLEHRIDQAIEAKVGWSADPQIVRANELLENGDLEGAINELRAYMVARPDAVDAHELLSAVYWRKGDTPAYLQALETVCALHLKARNVEAAWETYEDYTRAGTKCRPAPGCRSVVTRKISSSGSELRRITRGWQPRGLRIASPFLPCWRPEGSDTANWASRTRRDDFIQLRRIQKFHTESGAKRYERASLHARKHVRPWDNTSRALRPGEPTCAS